MSQNDEAEWTRIYQQWHEFTKAREAEKLIDLYADDAVLETPVVMAILDDKTEGVLADALRSNISSTKACDDVPMTCCAGTEPASFSQSAKW